MSKIEIIFQTVVMGFCLFVGAVNLTLHPVWSKGFLFGGLFPTVIALIATGVLIRAWQRGAE